MSLFLWVCLGLILLASTRCDRKAGSPAPGKPGEPPSRPTARAPREVVRPAAPRDAGAAVPARELARAADAGASAPRPDARDGAAQAPVQGQLAPLAKEADFGAEGKRFFDMLFCEGLPADTHCQKLAEAMERYRKGYRDPMRAWLAKERPVGLPSTLLYPFAGGDLVSALSAFPDQREFVHLSLEHGGPPAPFKDSHSAKLHQARGMLYRMSELLLRHGESFSVDLQKQEQALLPGVLPMLLVGVKVHGGTPTGLAYVKVTPEGKLEHWTRAELDAPGPRAKRLYTTWKDPRFSARFASLELRFRLPGDTADRRIVHLSANLANVGLKRAPGVDTFLGALGPVAVMIKASSYLMWTKDFSRIQELIFANARFAVSDFTAPYPGWLKKRGFELALHGRYDCMRNPRLRESAKPWIDAFRRPASRKLPFRWGYIDCKDQNHVVLIRK